MPQTITHEIPASQVRKGDTFRGETVQDVQTKRKYTHIRLPVSTVVKEKDEIVTVFRDEPTEEEKAETLRRYVVHSLQRKLDAVRGEGPFRSYGEKFASGDAGFSDIESFVKLQAQVYYWSWVLRRVDEDGEDIVEAAIEAMLQAVRDTVRGPNDRWSGRQNDLERMYWDGTRQFVHDVQSAGVTTGSEDIDKFISRIW